MTALPQNESTGALATSASPHYNVLSTLVVPGAEIALRGLVAIVGPNSSGKTQLLKDIHAVLTGQKRQLVVANEIRLSKPASIDQFLSPLLADGHLKKELDQNGNEILHQTSPAYGGGEFKNRNTALGTANSWFGNWGTDPISKNAEPVPFLDMVGHCLITSLFLENRITLANQVESFDYEKAPPTKDLQALYVNADAQQKLAERIRDVFGRGLWLDNTRGNILCLRVNNDPIIPPAEELRQPQEMRKYREIDFEGDGLRSYVGICIAMLLGRKPVCLIDEPELCLHPPQAYAMGRFIGSYGTAVDHSTFTSTHSSHVLRGIVETSNNVQIVRLTRIGANFKAHVIGREILLECLSRPILRAETILDGIFADGVTIVEADGDRAVYQTAWEVLQERQQKSAANRDAYLHRDVLFIPSGGTGGISDICKFYRALKIPVAIIADLDLLLDLPKIDKVLSRMTDVETAEQIRSGCRELSELIRSLPPVVSENYVRDALTELSHCALNWSNNDDIALHNNLSRLAKETDRMRRLKHGGLEQFSEHVAIYELLKSLIESCHKVGLFVVPVGELENWSPELCVSASKNRKQEWANEAAILVKQRPEKASEILAFIEAVGKFHADEIRRMAQITDVLPHETMSEVSSVELATA